MKKPWRNPFATQALGERRKIAVRRCSVDAPGFFQPTILRMSNRMRVLLGNIRTDIEYYFSEITQQAIRVCNSVEYGLVRASTNDIANAIRN